MTAQIVDRVIYEDETYDIVGLKGNGLVSPYDFDMEPVMMHTGCYRGYYVEYTIREGRLVLTQMTVRRETKPISRLMALRPSSTEV